MESLASKRYEIIMCGICGLVDLAKGAETQRDLLQKMNDRLRHRGPDAEGLYIQAEAGLGHRRLAIIDLASGAQPMTSADQKVTLVFNGEIYNFPELRAELESVGRIFKTHSDTEVILQGYIHWGDSVVKKLNGMFALAIWDANLHRLFMARDRLGKKPLYYSHSSSRFLFSSELKSIISDDTISREINAYAVNAFFSYGYIPAPNTIFSSVQKLRPGHTLAFQNGQITVNRFWDVDYTSEASRLSETEIVDQLEEKFKAAVKRRLMSEVPLGAFLSGGLDSSAVVGMMAKLSSQPVKTFTIDFAESGYSEAADARLVAKAFGTEHREFTVNSDAISILPDLVWHADEPFGDSSMVPTYYVSKMARSEVTVILSGDGGDELFAGYNSYGKLAGELPGEKIPEFIRKHLFGKLSGMLPMDAPGKNFFAEASQLHRRHTRNLVDLFPFIKQDLFSREWMSRFSNTADPADEILYWRNIPRGSSLSAMQYWDTKIYLPEDILMKVDKMSMAVSLETRAPILDYTLVEFAASIPTELQRKDGKGKYFFRKMAERYLPHEILHKKKQGFALPRDKWFRGEWMVYVKELLLSSQFEARGYFRPESIRRMLNAHAQGRKDFSTWIWCLTVFEMWHRQFVDLDTRWG